MKEVKKDNCSSIQSVETKDDHDQALICSPEC
ncbi:hypothetical protein AAZX31_01G056200 [Glycine max]